MIDKSIRQYYQNGERVDPYRKGLEMIAGKGKGAFQTTVPDKITAKSLIQPTEKMTLPSVKASKAAPFIRTLPTIAQPSLDSAQYSGLASIIPKTEEGSYLDKYINRDPVRIARGVAEKKPTVEDTAAVEDINIASLVGTDKATTSSDIDNILAPLAQISNEGATSYTDTQMQNIIKNANPDEKNFITTIVKTANDTIDNLGIDKTKIATNLVKNKVGKVVATELGISGGAAGGPIGMLIGWLVGKAVEKFTGGKEDKIDDTKTIYGLGLSDNSADKSVDKPTVVDTAAMEDIIAPAPRPYSSPARPHGGGGGGGGGNGGGGGFGKGNDPGGGAAGSPFFKGGRVDKPLMGRRRDI